MFNCIQRNKSCRVEREASRRHCYLLKSLSRLHHRLCKQEVIITQAFHLGILMKYILWLYCFPLQSSLQWSTEGVLDRGGGILSEVEADFS